MPFDKRPSHVIARETVNRLAHELGLEIGARFVPFSQSRNAQPRAGRAQPWQSINWRITLSRNGRPVLKCDYSQGVAHCPASRSARFPVKGDRQRAIALEIESGRVAGVGIGGSAFETAKRIPAPDLADVLHSLALDSSVLDYAGFSEWAGDLGYDSDSISAESTYRECLAHALALRASIGESALAKLREAAGEM